MKKEIRCFPASLTIRKSDDGKEKITGYAARFNKDSEDLGGFVERISPGAFADALKTSDTRALWNHNADHPLGRVSAGTLRLKEDAKGLFMELDPPDTTFAKDLLVSINRGDVREQSFAFSIAEDRWEDMDNPDEMTVRTIERVSHLYDVSPVTYPAYPSTDVALRRMQEAKGLPVMEIDALLDDLTEDDLSEVDELLDDL
jgi:HK97 family phage prohead protease